MDVRFKQVLKSVAELPEQFEIVDGHELKSDLGIDSLGLIDVVLGIEEEFEVELAEDELAAASTAGELWNIVERVIDT